MIRRSANDSRRAEPEDRFIPATVVKVGRVWIELVSTDKHQYRMSWRMRRDTQDQDTRYPGSSASFLTMDQYAWTETRNGALATIHDHGLTVESRSPWRGREVELADLLTNCNSCPRT
jgi:hypothetical protein